MPPPCNAVAWKPPPRIPPPCMPPPPPGRAEAPSTLKAKAPRAATVAMLIVENFFANIADLLIVPCKPDRLPVLFVVYGTNAEERRCSTAHARKARCAGQRASRGYKRSRAGQKPKYTAATGRRR